MELNWRFHDPSYEAEVSEVSHKINGALGENHPWKWRFSWLPGTTRSIEITFDNFLESIRVYPFDISHIQLPDFEKATPVPTYEPKTVFSNKVGLSIDYAVFRSPQKKDLPSQTVMLIPGGPHQFVQYRKYSDYINFFNEQGFHVVIPQGLFRKGYPPSYTEAGQGQFGVLDIELLKCVLQDLRDQSIMPEDERVCLFGASYGGYCCARLACFSELVQAAFIQNAMLDLKEHLSKTNFGHFRYFIKREGGLEDAENERIEDLSPALAAPLPNVPIFLISAQNDVRCPVEQSRKFAERLKGETLPLTYLECSTGGHHAQFSHFTLITDFFRGTYGDDKKRPLPQGYEIRVDTNSFFQQG